MDLFVPIFVCLYWGMGTRRDFEIEILSLKCCCINTMQPISCLTFECSNSVQFLSQFFLEPRIQCLNFSYFGLELRVDTDAGVDERSAWLWLSWRAAWEYCLAGLEMDLATLFRICYFFWWFDLLIGWNRSYVPERWLVVLSGSECCRTNCEIQHRLPAFAVSQQI